MRTAVFIHRNGRWPDVLLSKSSLSHGRSGLTTFLVETSSWSFDVKVRCMKNGKLAKKRRGR